MTSQNLNTTNTNLNPSKKINVKPETKTAKVLFAAMLAVIFGNFVLWTYDSKGVFIIYGIVHAITLKLLEGKCTTLNPLA